MTTVLLIRHGRTSANTAGILAGRSSGVVLDDVGRRQVAEAAARISGVPVKAIVSSPLRRCRQTAQALVAARAVGAIRSWDARLGAEHGSDAVWVAVSHGDPIKAILADALGMHLDSFQRIVVDPAAISIVRYTGTRPFVITVNSSTVDLGAVFAPRPKG